MDGVGNTTVTERGRRADLAPMPPMPGRETVAGLEAGPGEISYPISLEKVANGFIVQVGCQRFVSKEWAEVSSELGLYFSNPTAAVRRWKEGGYK